MAQPFGIDFARRVLLDVDFSDDAALLCESLTREDVKSNFLDKFSPGLNCLSDISVARGDFSVEVEPDFQIPGLI